MVLTMKYSIYFAFLTLENQNKRSQKKKANQPEDDLLRTDYYFIYLVSYLLRYHSD